MNQPIRSPCHDLRSSPRSLGVMETGDWQGRRNGRTAGIHRSVVCHAANCDRRNRKSEPDLRDGERFLLAALGDLNPIASVATSGAIRIVGDEREFPGRALRAAQSALRSSRAVQSVGVPQALPRAEMTHHPPNHFRCAILQDGGSNCIDHTSSGYSRVGLTSLRTAAHVAGIPAAAGVRGRPCSNCRSLDPEFLPAVPLVSAVGGPLWLIPCPGSNRMAHGGVAVATLLPQRVCPVRGCQCAFRLQPVPVLFAVRRSAGNEASPARFALPGIDRDTRAPSVRLDAGPLSKPEPESFPVHEWRVRLYANTCGNSGRTLSSWSAARADAQTCSFSRSTSLAPGRGLPVSFAHKGVRRWTGLTSITHCGLCP